MTVSPSGVELGSTVTNMKFSFRADANGFWLDGAQVKLTVPAAWTAPQTNTTTGPGFIKAINFGTAVSIASITGTGPWDITLNYQGANGITKGFDLTYTNFTLPSETGDYIFTAASKQAGSTFTNLAASPVVTVLIRQPQTIDFPAFDYKLSSDHVALQASASSGLPVAFSLLSGPATLSGLSNLVFTSTGMVRVAAAQTGNVAWFPAVTITNTFHVYAGGSMTLAPELAMAACPTNVLRYKFRGDAIGPWVATGSQVRITIPATWPEPQSNSAVAAGYVKVTLVSGTAASLHSITGTGPWDVVVNYQGAKDSTRGFDLAYTNIITPAAGLYTFETVCQQRGVLYTNTALDTAIELVDGADQAIDFQPLENQMITTDVGLIASASSALPVAFKVASGPGSISGLTNLSFTGTGVVVVTAEQNGNAYWRPAESVSRSLTVFAGGTLALTPATVFSGSSTNLLKFAFRGDGLADWAPGSQIRLTVPEGWTPPQTNAAATPGFLRTLPVGAGVQTVSISDISGSGPWDVTVNYAGGKATTKGFDLTYTNVTPPTLTAVNTFAPVCQQFGLSFTNPALNPSILVVSKTNQTITFPPIEAQFVTNKIVLSATADSGLPVTFAPSAPGTLTALTNLSFTATGTVSVTASQAGNLYWFPANPVTNTLKVLAGGTLSVFPTNATVGSTTNAFKFYFRSDSVAAWAIGSQVVLTIPAEWPHPQNTAAGDPGYISVITNGTGGAVSIEEITGSGPWDVVVNYSGNSGTNRGFNLTYTNLTIPGPEGVFPFASSCRQSGITAANPSMQPGITVVVKTEQTIDFPAINNQMVTNRITLNATASSGLPVAYAVSGPYALSGGTNLTFTNSGIVTVTASQIGDGDWHPATPVTNQFHVFAGGSMSLSPEETTETSATNLLTFTFRGDGAGSWQSGSQIRIRIPDGWSTPQTNAAADPGYLRITPISSTVASLASIDGNGPWDVTINYQGAKEITRGFNLTFTNVTAPSATGPVVFETQCRQFGQDFSIPGLNQAILVVEGSDQTITFPDIGYLLITNKATLNATASSGLPVRYDVSGPCTVTGLTNLTFTSTGVVTVVASQDGNLNWHPAVSITNIFRIFPGGTLKLTPDTFTAQTATNALKFSFRGDGVAAWSAGSQIQITIPEGWTPPQTSSPTEPGYVKATLVAATAVSIDSIDGTGPWDIRVNYQGAKEITRGFDLTYTNVTTPTAAGVSVFAAKCWNAGFDFINPALKPSALLVSGEQQSIDFPAIDHQLTTNKLTLHATASSGLSVNYSFSGPVAVSGISNLTFTGAGMVSIVAEQEGNLNWYPAPSITNQFQVLAGGSMALTPLLIRGGSTTNVLKFILRNDGIGDWQDGSQFRVTIPAGWSEPQTNLPSGPGYIKVLPFGTGMEATIDGISGSGPWDVVLNYSGLKTTTKGFDLTFTNVAAPEAASVYDFDTACTQFGVTVTNIALNRSITVVEGTNQVVSFDSVDDQVATNKVGLRASASSGLPVTFSVQSGPAAITSATNLSFTGTGTVIVAASQQGTLYWVPASTTISLAVSPAILVPTVTVKNKIYDGTVNGSTNVTTLTGKAAGDAVSVALGAVVEFDDKHVGTAKPATVSALTLAGSAAAKYMLSTTIVTDTASITEKAITVRAAGDTKVYDGTILSDGVPTITVGSLAPGDSGNWTQAYDTKNAGTGKVMTPTGTANDGNGGANYAVTFATRATGSITKKPLSVTGASVTAKVYDKTTAAQIVDGALTGVLEGESVTLSGFTGIFAQADVGDPITVATAFAISGPDVGNYSLVQPALTGAITPRALSVTGAAVVDKEFDGTTAATITNAVLEGVLSGDDVQLDSLAGTFSQAEAGENIPVTALLTLKGLAAFNYALIQPAGLTGTITGGIPLVITTAGQDGTGPHGKGFRLSWQGSGTCQYAMEYTDTLSPTNWIGVPGCTAISGSNGVMSATDTNALPSSRFYRLKRTN